MALDFNPSTLTNDERRAEKNRILFILRDSGVSNQDMTEKEAEFVDQMLVSTYVSPAQLNSLRRIKDKYL